MSSSAPISKSNHISTSHTQGNQNSTIVCNTIYYNNYLSHTWILDSCAKDHVCSCLSVFDSYYKIKLLKITLPNGNFTMVHYAGNVRFSPILYLNHVLYAPDFSLNLIYNSKLCHNLKCSATFSVDQCVLQELNSMRMIGLGSEENGLYMLKIKDPHLAAKDSLHNTQHRF